MYVSESSQGLLLLFWVTESGHFWAECGMKLPFKLSWVMTLWLEEASMETTTIQVRCEAG